MIRPQAEIFFDWNEPIATPEIFNTIDADAPNSSVIPLPVTAFFATIPVSWAASDDAGGSGVSTYDVYVSQDRAAPTLWLSRTTSTSATYLGVDQATYRFYSVASDYVGHRETVPTTYDTETQVVLYPWHNYTKGPDVNADGRVVPMDALNIINELNARQYIDESGKLPVPPPMFLPPYSYDVNKDGFATPIDALVVINYLNAGGSGEAEDRSERADAGVEASMQPVLWRSFSGETASGWRDISDRGVSEPDDASAAAADQYFAAAVEANIAPERTGLMVNENRETDLDSLLDDIAPEIPWNIVDLL